jgi:hypothetical protein
MKGQIWHLYSIFGKSKAEKFLNQLIDSFDFDFYTNGKILTVEGNFVDGFDKIDIRKALELCKNDFAILERVCEKTYIDLEYFND